MRWNGAQRQQQIDPRSPREVFAEFLAGAAADGRAASPLVLGYLADLLSEHVRAPASRRREAGGEPTLAESLLRARLERGAARLRCMRALGDRALFVAGFFGDSLARGLADLDYYEEIGRSAYEDVAGALEARWSSLFRELARRWVTLVDVLAEVGDRARLHRSPDLLRLYERCLLTGSPRDRGRLARLGHVPPARRGRGRPQ